MAGTCNNNEVKEEDEFLRKDEIVEAEEEQEKIKVSWKDISKVGIRNFLKIRGLWKPLVNTITFLIHFIIVMLILFLGAMFLALVEDQEYFSSATKANQTTQNSTTAVDTSIRYKNFSYKLQKELNITVNEQELRKLIKEVKKFSEEDEIIGDKIVNKTVKDQKFIFMKWLYFGVITTTTIGYGDISPKTDKGKLFCIFFVVIGIILMMTLLARCGGIISTANKKFYGLINKYILRGQKLISAELLSLISINIIFVCFLIVGILYGKYSGTNDWELIDVIYFWLVTFTTCGYGDILYPIETEVEKIFEHTMYRVFGLAILAAIIDAIRAYLVYKKAYLEKLKELAKKPRLKLPMPKNVMQGNILGGDITSKMPKFNIHMTTNGSDKI